MVFRPHLARKRTPSTSPLRFIRRQHLSYIRLGNPKLSRNTGWRDASLEGCTNGIHLTARQRDFGDVHGSASDLILCGRAFDRQSGSDVEPMAYGSQVCFNAWRQSASPLDLFECCRMHQVQLAITQMFDGATQILGQDMPLRCAFGRRPSGYLALVAVVKHLGPCRSRTGQVSVVSRVASHNLIMSRSLIHRNDQRCDAIFV